jgi:cytidine deaminase
VSAIRQKSRAKTKAPSIDWKLLQRMARAASKKAYAPYSGYQVGAALLASDGRIFLGANVENASYGLAQCAERTAIGAAVVAGARKFVAIAIASPGSAPASPCGMCRQVLSEFPPSFSTRCFAETGEPIDSTVAALLPGAFGPAELAQASKGIEKRANAPSAMRSKRAAR